MTRKNKEIISRVLRWRDQAGINNTEFGHAIGVTSAAITNWQRRGVVPADKHERIAQYFGRSVDELLGLVKERSVEDLTPGEVRYVVFRVPLRYRAVIGQEGYWLHKQHPAETGDGFINMPSQDSNAYSVRIMGDTTHSRVRSGEYVVVEPSHPLVAGEEVLIITKDGRYMVRDFLSRSDGRLVVQNIHGQRLTFRDEEIDAVHYIAAITKHALYSKE